MRKILSVCLIAAACGCFAADEPPVIPVGADAYRQWDRWPVQRIGARAYMRSTYDRRGGNEGADAAHFLYQLRDDFNVTLDVAGPGILYFARYNHWHGSPWHYEVDGNDTIVQETTTEDPLHPAKDSVFLPKEAFPKPLAWTWSTTKGADLSWVPIGFEKSFRMAYGRTCYGTGYYIYHQFVRGAKLSQPISAWDGKSPPSQDILDLINRSGTNLFPKDAAKNVFEESGEANVPQDGIVTLATLSAAPATIRAIEFSAPKEAALELSRARLRITWDGRAQPSVDAPLPLFFGAGTLYNRDDAEYLVKAFPVSIRFDDKRVYLACYFPMPFFKSAKIELAASGASINGIKWAVRGVPLADPQHHVAYFHATYRDHPQPEAGQDLVLLNTQETEGGGDWSGNFVGTSFIFSHNAKLGTLEGDPRFFFDDSQTPQAQGTGTEEWGGGGDYWGGKTMTLPFAGHPVGCPNEKSAKNDIDKIQSAYRFLLADLMPFGKNALIRLEHGGANESGEHYETVTYWYGAPQATLIKTDELKIGDDASEKSHRYVSPDASVAAEITSRYEWGPDTAKGKVVYPPTTDTERHTKGTSEFSVKIDPENHGVMLRRKLDYQFPNQRAEIFIADSAKPDEWKPAGTWYTAGSNTCVYSKPGKELGPTEHNIQTSNRRFRDDEFLVPKDLTQGRSEIRVRVQFTPANIPLFIGQPLAEQAWSEMKYSVYCFKLKP